MRRFVGALFEAVLMIATDIDNNTWEGFQAMTKAAFEVDTAKIEYSQDLGIIVRHLYLPPFVRLLTCCVFRAYVAAGRGTAIPTCPSSKQCLYCLLPLISTSSMHFKLRVDVTSADHIYEAHRLRAPPSSSS